jgi:Flp pilus assembly protein TadG
MKQMTRRRLTRDTNGTTTLEFAIVASVLVAMLLGGMEIGLRMWTRGTLQSVAEQTARCAAIGSPLCSTPSIYAAGLATAWLGSAMIPAANVTAVSGATSCLNESTGTTTFEVVTITATPWVGVSTTAWFRSIFGSLGPTTETVTACYPT